MGPTKECYIRSYPAVVLYNYGLSRHSLRSDWYVCSLVVVRLGMKCYMLTHHHIAANCYSATSTKE
jgi:hypothetical protein